MADLIPTGASAPLVPTFTGMLAGIEQTLVDARTLHGALGSGYHFSHWMRDRIEQHLLAEGEDFAEVFQESLKNPLGGRPATDYHLSLDTAKHLALAERTEQGRVVRQYFIEVERHARVAVGQLQAQVRELLAEKAQRTLADNPRLAYALRVHHKAQAGGLTHEECARLMGWKTPATWAQCLRELAALGLIDYHPNPARSAAGQRAFARLLAHNAQQGQTPAQLAARQANAQRAHAAQRAARKGGAA